MDLLGFVGTFASGKDEAADYLATKGWNHVPTGELLRNIARLRGVDLDRASLKQLADDLRAKEGASYLVELACLGSVPLVVSGIRNLGEASYFLGNRGKLVAFDAPLGLRFRRIKARGRADDPKTLDEFIAMQQAEESDDPSAQNIPAVMKMAKKKIWNCHSHTYWLHQELDRLVQGSPP